MKTMKDFNHHLNIQRIIKYGQIPFSAEATLENLLNYY